MCYTLEKCFKWQTNAYGTILKNILKRMKIKFKTHLVSSRRKRRTMRRCLYKNGPIPASFFVYFRLFHKDTIQYKLIKA